MRRFLHKVGEQIDEEALLITAACVLGLGVMVLLKKLGMTDQDIFDLVKPWGF